MSIEKRHSAPWPDAKLVALQKASSNDALGSSLWNKVSSAGAILSVTSIALFLFIVYEAFARKRVAGDNPWGPGATTLEWTLSSPPPFHQFETLPRIVDEPGHH